MSKSLMTVYQRTIKILSPASASVSLGSCADSRQELRCSLDSESVMFMNLMASSLHRALHSSLGSRALEGFHSPTTGGPVAFNALGTLS